MGELLVEVSLYAYAFTCNCRKKLLLFHYKRNFNAIIIILEKHHIDRAIKLNFFQRQKQLSIINLVLQFMN